VGDRSEQVREVTDSPERLLGVPEIVPARVSVDRRLSLHAGIVDKVRWLATAKNCFGVPLPSPRRGVRLMTLAHVGIRFPRIAERLERGFQADGELDEGDHALAAASLSLIKINPKPEQRDGKRRLLLTIPGERFSAIYPAAGTTAAIIIGRPGLIEIWPFDALTERGKIVWADLWEQWSVRRGDAG
jgi:hypothetical protein